MKVTEISQVLNFSYTRTMYNSSTRTMETVLNKLNDERMTKTMSCTNII